MGAGVDVAGWAAPAQADNTNVRIHRMDRLTLTFRTFIAFSFSESNIRLYCGSEEMARRATERSRSPFRYCIYTDFLRCERIQQIPTFCKKNPALVVDVKRPWSDVPGKTMNCSLFQICPAMEEVLVRAFIIPVACKFHYIPNS